MEFIWSRPTKDLSQMEQPSMVEVKQMTCYATNICKDLHECNQRTLGLWCDLGNP